jgi:acyl dehydratase
MIDPENIAVGAAIPAASYGPLTIIDTVRWAGVQENSEQVHWDREFVREHSKLRTFIASGAYRQALLARTLTDWIGPHGWLRRMQVRHVAPLFEGDTITCGGRVVAVSDEAGARTLTCDVEGHNQDGLPLLTGQCTLILRTGKAAAPGRDARGGTGG